MILWLCKDQSIRMLHNQRPGHQSSYRFAALRKHKQRRRRPHIADDVGDGDGRVQNVNDIII